MKEYYGFGQTMPHAGNKGLAKWRVHWLNELWCFYQTYVQGESVVLLMPPLRQAPNRYILVQDEFVFMDKFKSFCSFC